ncbi:hypothetical protein CR983_01365 [Candidatus Saccharibacteria bacterium]|nr:MAG: hypothetical protein CR983_01365 [Candidatus Saccharibacteria bacterium]
MKLRTMLISALVLLGVASTAMTTNAYATPLFKMDDDVSIQAGAGEGSTVDGVAFLAGNSVTIDGTVNGDVFCAANSIVVTGTINGDLLCSGNSITVNGDVTGDVRLAASSVTINGTIGGDATIFAGSVTLGNDATIARDLTGASATFVLNGTIKRDAILGAEQVTIGGMVGGDVDTDVSLLTLSKNSEVKGDIRYTSEKDATINGTVGGETTRTPVNEHAAKNHHNASPLALLAGALMGALTIGLLVVLGAVLLPRAVEAYANVSWGRVGIAAVVGLTVVVVMPIVALLLLATLVGVVLSYVVVLVWLLLMALSPIWAGYFVGSKLMAGRSTHVLLRATVGALVLMVLLMIPVVNILTMVVVVLVGTGLPLLVVPRLFDNKPYVVKASRTHAKKKARA